MFPHIITKGAERLTSVLLVTHSACSVQELTVCWPVGFGTSHQQVTRRYALLVYTTQVITAFRVACVEVISSLRDRIARQELSFRSFFGVLTELDLLKNDLIAREALLRRLSGRVVYNFGFVVCRSKV